MKKIILAIGILICFATCKKSGNMPKPNPIVPSNNTGCLITNHTYTGNGPFEGRTVYHYDKNGQMTDVEFFNSTYGIYPAIKDTIYYSRPGDVHTLYTEVGSKSDHHIPDIATSIYSGGLTPAQSTVSSLQGGDYKPGQNPNSPTTNYKYTFNYDDKNRMVKVYEFIHDVKMDIYYNDKNNVTSIVIEPLTGTRGTTTITVSAYDDKPNPYSNIPYWKLVRHWGWYDAYDQEELLTSLSQNNPMDFTLTANYIGSPIYTFSRVMTYTYNDKGLPVSRGNTQTQTGQAGSSTYNDTFEYSCK